MAMRRLRHLCVSMAALLLGLTWYLSGGRGVPGLATTWRPSLSPPPPPEAGSSNSRRRLEIKPGFQVVIPRRLRGVLPRDWPRKDRETWLNAVYYPWAVGRVNDACRLLGIRFLTNVTSSQTRALVSFPGSGNTWVRATLEAVGGVFTGSVYQDGFLAASGLLGEMLRFDSGLTVLQKTHGDATKSPALNEFSRHHVREFGCRGVLLFRHPAAAIVAHRHLDEGGHLGHAPLAAFNGTEWRQYVAGKIAVWRDLYSHWLRECEPSGLRIAVYERFRADLGGAVRRLLADLGVPVDENRIQCLLKYGSGSVERRKLYQGVELFDEDQREQMARVVDTVNKLLLAKKNFSLPYLR
ncbi:unnamed protein product [Notodromas monacha]|uniref:Sulfotransferase n=1 Tax=Notodromas monacha TaxID=399045 RepID=A0A7R9GGP8_9CRUS|nr:unnamed protein product [Notodromas monacha]CAG0921948.1 unnamed protein product [Notodromas monacha]